MKKTLSYALWMGAVSLGIALILYFIKEYMATRLVHPQYLVIIVFLYILSLTTTAFVNFGVERHRDKFNVFFFPALIFRFFASVIFILVVIFMKLPDMLYFVANFFVLYLLYQVFEITSLMTNLRSHLENRGNEDN